MTARANAPGILVASATGTIGLELRVVPVRRELLGVDAEDALNAAS